MKKLGLSLAFSLTPMSAMAAAIVVDAGTTVDGGLINPVQTQQVYGTANNFSIYGNQQVMSGGVANNSNVFSGGQQNISSGGTAHNTNIQASAVQYVYGVANSTNIASQGSSTVNRGGVVNETTINGGTLSVLSGGKALGTILQSGTESVSGTDVGSVINGGVQQVNRNGTVQNTQINGGEQKVLVRGTATGSIISGGVQNVYGDSLSSEIKDNGVMNVYSSGYAENTLMSGGEMNVLSGGFSSGVQISGGVETVYGFDINGTVNGGIQKVEADGQAEDTVIQGSGVQQILSGGYGFNANIKDGGIQIAEQGGYAYRSNVYDGGVLNALGEAYEVTVYDGGVLNVEDGGLAADTQVNGGVLTVNQGGTSQNTILASGAENVYGTSNGTQINGGVQNVYGVANSSVIASGAKQEVYTGGTASKTVINDGALQTVYGIVNSSVLSAGGVLNVEDGGSAADTQVNGGVLTIHQGGTSQNTILASGAENVYGTSNGTQINGGVQNVYGVANSSVIASGAKQEVYTGGTASKTVINDGALQTVYGIVNSSILSAGGALNVEDGGLAADTQINGGALTIHQGGTSQNTILASGAENVYGTSNATQINGGVQNVYGVANSSVVASGGEQRVYGDVQSTQVNQSGILTVLSGGNVQNAQLTSGTLNLYSGGTLSGKISAVESVINVYGDNDIANLELDKSLVTMVKRGDYGTLNIENLNGTGIFNISTDLSANQSDTINVQNGDGEFGLWINDYSMDEAPDKYKIIDESTVAHENFYLIGGAVDVGAYQYKLVQEGNDWYLENTEKLNDTTYIAKNTYSTLSSLFYAHLSPVYSRIFEKHKKDRHAGGLWTKAIGRRIEQNFKDGTSSQTDVYGGNIGFDHEVLQDDDYQVRLGVYTSYSHSKQEYNHLGKAEGNTQSYGVYSSLTTKENWFVDVLGAYFTHRQSVNSYTPAGDLVTGKYDTYGWQTTLTAGKRFEFDNDWYLEPHVGVGYMWVNGVRYRTNFNTLIEGSSQDNVKGSVGVNGGKVYQLSEKAKMEVFGKFSLIHDWKSESKVWVADYLMEEDMSSLHYKLGAGVKGSWNENQSAFVEISTHLGSNLDIPYEITLGYQYEF